MSALHYKSLLWCLHALFNMDPSKGKDAKRPAACSPTVGDQDTPTGTDSLVTYTCTSVTCSCGKVILE